VYVYPLIRRNYNTTSEINNEETGGRTTFLIIENQVSKMGLFKLKDRFRK